MPPHQHGENEKPAQPESSGQQMRRVVAGANDAEFAAARGGVAGQPESAEQRGGKKCGQKILRRRPENARDPENRESADAPEKDLPKSRARYDRCERRRVER